MTDPYANEPNRHKSLKPTSKKPYVAEIDPYSLLVENFISPNELFFVRNHSAVPDIDSAKYKLEVRIEGQLDCRFFTYSELRTFPKHTITATLMCAGNRRGEMAKIKPINESNWGPAAVSNAEWSGVRLSKILQLVGVEDDDKFKHIQFEGGDVDVERKESYRVSIPLWKALDKKCEVLVAYEMNGEDLSRDHGYPVRVLVPGVVGARSVKWLIKIVISSNECDSYWQQNYYKAFAPSVDWKNVDFSTSPAIQEMPVTSAICFPGHGETTQVEDRHVLVKGYAWSGGGQKIIRVDVTVNGGKTWETASLDKQDKATSPSHWAWTFWSFRIPVRCKNCDCEKVEIWAKAVDSCYNTQPESSANIWNLIGVLNNAYHKVIISLENNKED